MLHSPRKKVVKLVPYILPAGDPEGAQYESFTFLLLNVSCFNEVRKSINERVMWQDPYYTRWEGATARRNLETIEQRHNWQESEEA